MATPIVELINNLYEMVEEAWSMPLGGDKCILERDKVLDILDEIRAETPREIKAAQEIVERRNQYLDEARLESDLLKKEAQEQAKTLVNADIITTEAKKKADAIVTAAEKRADEMMKVAQEYCEEAMREAEQSLSKTLDELRSTKGRFEKAVSKKSKKTEI